MIFLCSSNWPICAGELPSAISTRIGSTFVWDTGWSALVYHIYTPAVTAAINRTSRPVIMKMIFFLDFFLGASSKGGFSGCSKSDLDSGASRAFCTGLLVTAPNGRFGATTPFILGLMGRCCCGPDCFGGRISFMTAAPDNLVKLKLLPGRQYRPWNTAYRTIVAAARPT